jgi:hypothetical protein
MKVKNDTTPVSLPCESLMDIAGELRRSIVRVSSTKIISQSTRGGPGFRDSLAAWLRWILGSAASNLLVCLRSIDFVGRPAAEGRVGPIGVVVSDPTSDPGSCLAAGHEGIQEHTFVFQRPPQPFE